MTPEERAIFMRLSDAQILGMLIDLEARSEPYDGRVAVGSSVLNRADYGQKKPKWGNLYGNTIKTVILAPAQYSCLNGGDYQWNRAMEIAKDFRTAHARYISLRGCLDVAEGLLSGTIKRNVKALYYNTLACDPKWDDKMKLEKVIGNHEFFV